MRSAARAPVGTPLADIRPTQNAVRRNHQPERETAGGKIVVPSRHAGLVVGLVVTVAVTLLCHVPELRNENALEISGKNQGSD
jgi:hypothetical protein